MMLPTINYGIIKPIQDFLPHQIDALKSHLPLNPNSPILLKRHMPGCP